MSGKSIYIISWLCCLLMMFFYGCTQPIKYRTLTVSKEDSLRNELRLKEIITQLKTEEKQIHSGDLVTRTGNDFTSESLRLLNRRDKTYSHCGIASIEHDSVFVYHALGGEFNPDQRIRKDLFINFASPGFNRGVGIFRFTISDSIQRKVVEIAQHLYHSDIMFDMQFDLATDNRMYCAEFVYKTFLRAAGTALHFNRSHIKSFEFIGVDDLFLEPHCKPLRQILYK